MNQKLCEKKLENKIKKKTRKKYSSGRKEPPTVEEIMEGNVTHVPDVIKLFIAQLVKNSLDKSPFPNPFFHVHDIGS